jgi:PAS domain S-box-containing protein
MDPIAGLLVAAISAAAGYALAALVRARRGPAPQSHLLAGLASANDALVVLDYRGDGPRIVEASPAFQRLSGYTADECVGRSPRFLHGPETDRAALERLDRAARDGRPARERLAAYRKDKSVFWVEVDLAPIAGSPGLCVAVQRDVTRDRGALSVAADGERRLVETLNALDMGFLVWDADDRLVFWNARYVEMFPHMVAILARGMTFRGYVEATSDRLRAMGLADRAAWIRTERAFWHRRFGEVFRQRASFDREIETVEFPSADGGSVAVYRDVTALAAAQRDVRDSRQRLLDSIEAIGDGIIVFDNDDKIVVWNRRYADMFPEIAGLLAPGVRVEELRARAIDQAQRLTTSRDALAAIERRVRPHRRFGEPFNLALASGRTLQTVEYATAEGGCVAVYRDVTDQITVEQALRESEMRMIDSIEAIGDGFLILDNEDRVRFWNRRYVEIFPHMAGLIEKGKPFQELFVAARGVLSERDGTKPRSVVTLDERLRRHRRFGETFNQHLVDGRIIETVQFAAADGGVVAIYRDVSAKIAAESARAESEARFQSLVANVDGVVYRRRVDRAWTMDFASSGIAGLTGYSADSFLPGGGRNFADLIAPEDREAAAAAVGAAVAMRREFEVEYRLFRADGEIAWALEKGRASYDSYGTPLHIDGIIVDQTDRRRREAELDRSRLAVSLRDRRFRDAIESMGDGFVLYDADDNVVAWNERYLELFPITRSIMRVGLPGLEVVRAHTRLRYPELAETELDALARSRHGMLRAGPVPPDDVPSGDRIVQISRRRTSEGGIVAILRDVTEERRASERVRASEARFRDAIASLADGFLQIDPDLRIAAWNERYLDFYPVLRGRIYEGLEFAQALRIAAAGDLSGPALDEWVAERLSKVRGAGFAGSEMAAVGGRDVRVTRTRMGDGGVVAVMRDVTGEVAAARELERAKNAAEVASRAKSEFLANMSHELRTPLNGVVGMLDVMLSADLPDESRRQAQMAREAAERLLQVIGDILDISKLEAGALQIDRAPFDLAGAVRAAARTFLASARAKGLSIDVETAPEIDGEALGDAARLGQILLNLVGNAVKFTERGGVRIEADRTPDRPDLVRISVRDTGPGIDEATKQRLFAKFFQADTSVTRRFGGTGLGLAISRELALAMGGDIAVEDAPGGGSIFRVTLPLPHCERDVSREPPPPEGLPAARWPGRRVLLVEDNDVNRYAAAKMLETLGVAIDEACDGAEALERASAARYDVILMDVQMPRVDGLEATRRLRSGGGPNARTPIVALTANAFVEDVERCRAAGMDGHLAKPIRATTLRAAVDGLLAGRIAPAVPAVSFGRSEPAAAISEEAIAALCADMPESAVRNLVRTFRVEQGRQIAELAELLARGDAAALARTAHSIKGAARLFGAELLAEQAQFVERCAREGRRDALDAAIAALGAKFGAVDEALHARFGSV